MSNDEEIIQNFEARFLDFIRTVTIFFIAGLAIYSFTRFGKFFSVVSFIIAAILIATSLYDYAKRRSEIIASGLTVNLTVDILAISMAVFLVINIWIIITVISGPTLDDYVLFAHSQREKEALESYKKQIETLGLVSTDNIVTGNDNKPEFLLD